MLALDLTDARWKLTIPRMMSDKTSSAVAALVLGLAVGLMLTPAYAGHGKHARSVHERPPLKDCTRFNARWGYYGNLWCTPAEQRAFDLYEAKRTRARLRR